MRRRQKRLLRPSPRLSRRASRRPKKKAPRQLRPRSRRRPRRKKRNSAWTKTSAKDRRGFTRIKKIGWFIRKNPENPWLRSGFWACRAEAIRQGVKLIV